MRWPSAKSSPSHALLSLRDISLTRERFLEIVVAHERELAAFRSGAVAPRASPRTLRLKNSTKCRRNVDLDHRALLARLGARVEVDVLGLAVGAPSRRARRGRPRRDRACRRAQRAMRSSASSRHPVRTSADSCGESRARARDGPPGERRCRSACLAMLTAFRRRPERWNAWSEWAVAGSRGKAPSPRLWQSRCHRACRPLRPETLRPHLSMGLPCCRNRAPTCNAGRTPRLRYGCNCAPENAVPQEAASMPPVGRFAPCVRPKVSAS